MPDHVAGFLAQQAVEKAIKAVLTAHGVAFECTHDVDYLCGLLEDSRLPLAPELRAAGALTPWAVEFRYVGPFQTSPLDRTGALETVQAVISWAARTIGE